ncbi:hypothetical protein WDW37_07240 [Bdellovibrionota bacterium FG-1]
MSKKVHYPIYFAEDKDVFDLLASSKRIFDDNRLIQIARKRGIILSASTSRDDLVQYLSRLTWGWLQIQELVALTESRDRTEKVANETVTTKLEAAKLQEAAIAVKKERSEKSDEVYSIHKGDDDKVTIKVSYTDFEPSRTRLSQRVQRDLLMEIEKTEDGYVFRHNANERGREIVSKIIEKLPRELEAPVVPERLSLAGIKDPAKRTEFFLHLIQNLQGFKLVNVTSVSVDRVAAEEDDHSKFEAELGSGSLVDQDDFESEGSTPDENAEETVEETAAMLSVVRKVALHGENLLGSPQFDQLKKDRFFLSRAVWRSSESRQGGNELDFEADFEDAKNCAGFRYNVLGIYSRKTRGNQEVKKTRAAVAASDRAKYLSLIERAAKAAHLAVVVDSPKDASSTTHGVQVSESGTATMQDEKSHRETKR